MAEINVFLVEGGTRTLLSEVNTTPLSELFADLDSTPGSPTSGEGEGTPLASPVKEIEVSARPGEFLDGVDVSFRGPSARFWSITEDDPNTNTSAVWVARLTEKSVDGRPESESRLRFWVKASTESGEAPVDDRSTPLEVNGRLRVGEGPTGA